MNRKVMRGILLGNIDGDCELNWQQNLEVVDRKAVRHVLLRNIIRDCEMYW